MKYMIDQFVLFELKGEVAIQNSSGFTLLKDSRIIKFFQNIDKDNRLEFTEEQLSSLFSDDTANIIDYLIKSKLIIKNTEKERFDKIQIYTNNSNINSSLKFNSRGSRMPIEIEMFNTLDMLNHFEQIIFDEKVLILVILIPFDYIDFVKISDCLQRKNVQHSISFSYNSKVYTTNIHKKEWYNPCPKCFFSQLEASLRSYNKNTSEITFQNIVDLLYSKKIFFNPDLPITIRNSLNFVYSVLNFDDLDSDINILANRIIKTNLKDEIIYDQAIHWELCDCFE